MVYVYTQNPTRLLFVSSKIRIYTSFNFFSLEAVMPDFAQVYNFIGSVFDPNSSDHLQKLKTMDPINVETV